MTRLRTWLSIWLGWTALALFFAAGYSLTYRSNGRPPNWSLSIERSLVEWWLWALATPVVVALARRFPLHSGRVPLNVAVHAVAGLALAIAMTQADRELFRMITGIRTYFLLSTVALYVAVYAGIVAASHGVEYYRRSRERDQLEARLVEARLQLLAMQLQPHFLFNTLNTIAELVHDDPDAADAMIAHLSALLRRTLQLGTATEISVIEEIELVRRYIAIQQARFGNRLHVSIDLDGRATTARVPALLLQPIVENAIRHGLATRLDAGRIVIRVRSEEAWLTFTVMDDGGALGTSVEGVGLGNTRARLDAMYSGRARLELASTADRETIVTIRLPRDATAAAS